MKPAPKTNHVGSKHPAGKASAPPRAARRKARTLFQVEAKPLDNTSPGGAALRVLRRSRSWLTLFLLVPILLLAAEENPAEAPPPSETPMPSAQPIDEVTPELPPVQLDEETVSEMATNVAAALTAQTAPALTNPPAGASAASDRERSQRQPAPATAPDQREEPGRGTESRNDRGNREPTRSTPPTQNPPGPGSDFSAYRIITERNIFDPNRSARRSNNTPRPRPKTVDSFALVGIMSYEKGTFAFFDGSRGEFKKAVRPAGEIAGFKVASVGPDAVRLSSENRDFDLKVGMQMRREEDGPWEKSSQSASYSSAPSAPPNSGGPGAGTGAPSQTSLPSTGNSSTDEVLKRLMQRREQE